MHTHTSERNLRSPRPPCLASVAQYTVMFCCSWASAYVNQPMIVCTRIIMSAFKVMFSEPHTHTHTHIAVSSMSDVSNERRVHVWKKNSDHTSQYHNFRFFFQCPTYTFKLRYSVLLSVFVLQEGCWYLWATCMYEEMHELEEVVCRCLSVLGFRNWLEISHGRICMPQAVSIYGHGSHAALLHRHSTRFRQGTPIALLAFFA